MYEFFIESFCKIHSSNYLIYSSDLSQFKKGLDKDIAKGLYIYLNSSLVDQNFRLFSGHTQVNATDLRNICYPSHESLRHMGKQMKSLSLPQEEVDEILESELDKLSNDHNT